MYINKVMFKIFARGISLVRRHFTNSNKLKLGRWDTQTCDKSKDIKFIYANIDNCGDLICGEPLKSQEYIKTKKKLPS